MNEMIGIGMALFVVLIFAAYVQTRAMINKARMNRRYEQYRDRGVDGFDANEDFGNKRG